MMLAAMNNNLGLVELLCQQNDIDIDSQDDRGYTSLHYAAQYASSEVVSSILAKGADVTIRNEKNDSALIRAARAGGQESVQSLMMKMAGAKNMKDAVSELSKLSSAPSPRSTLDVREFLDAAGQDKLTAFVLSWQSKYGF